jgi:hypothetical protein
MALEHAFLDWLQEAATVYGLVPSIRELLEKQQSKPTANVVYGEFGPSVDPAREWLYHQPPIEPDAARLLLLAHHYRKDEISKMLEMAVEACRAHIKSEFPSDPQGAAAFEHLLGERLLANSKFSSKTEA